jgi:hypothetical protein
MDADHFFTIGSSHAAQGTPCEDYALSGTILPGFVRDDFSYGVVADGCSGANANTDIGARAISWAFKHALEEKDTAPGEWFSGDFNERLLAAFAKNRYSLSEGDGMATVIGFAATPSNASVYVHGDGAVAVRYADGRICLTEFNWWNNTPWYLNYRLHLPLLDMFMEPFEDGVIEPFVQRTVTFQETASGLEVLHQEVQRFTLDQVFCGHVLNFKPAEEGIVALAVFSDGVEQLLNLELMPAVKEFMAFKNHKGDFVKRRLIKALKAFQKDHHVPRDDLGMACVWFGDEA